MDRTSWWNRSMRARGAPANVSSRSISLSSPLLSHSPATPGSSRGSRRLALCLLFGVLLSPARALPARLLLLPVLLLIPRHQPAPLADRPDGRVLVGDVPRAPAESAPLGGHAL